MLPALGTGGPILVIEYVVQAIEAADVLLLA
jgi:hypothetical protein